VLCRWAWWQGRQRTVVADDGWPRRWAAAADAGGVAETEGWVHTKEKRAYLWWGTTGVGLVLLLARLNYVNLWDCQMASLEQQDVHIRLVRLAEGGSRRVRLVGRQRSCLLAGVPLVPRPEP